MLKNNSETTQNELQNQVKLEPTNQELIEMVNKALTINLAKMLKEGRILSEEQKDFIHREQISTLKHYLS